MILINFVNTYNPTSDYRTRFSNSIFSSITNYNILDILSYIKYFPDLKRLDYYYFFFFVYTA